MHASPSRRSPTSRRPRTRLFTLGVAMMASLAVGSIAAGDPLGQVTAFPTGISPGAWPSYITAGPDGNLWFLETAGQRIGRVTPEGEVTEFASGVQPKSALHGITAGSDGNIWVADGGKMTRAIVRMAPDGVATRFSPTPCPITNCWWAGIAPAPDGSLWAGESGGGLARITTSGTISAVPGGPASGLFGGLTAGPDGNMWLATNTATSGPVARITPEGFRTQFWFPDPNPLFTAPGTSGITPGPDGNLWLAASAVDQIARMTTSGTSVRFFSGITPGSSPRSIAAGPDGAMWFTEWSGNRIGRITMDGAVTEFSVGTTPTGIAAGPDGNMWFTEGGSNRVGKIGTGAGAVVTTALSGTPAPGEVLTCTPTLSTSTLGSPSSTTYTWLRGGQTIAGAAAVYALTNADSGAVITCRASLTLGSALVQMAATSNALTVSGTRPGGGRSGAAAGLPTLKVATRTKRRVVTTTGAVPATATRIAQAARTTTGTTRTARPRCTLTRIPARKGKKASRRFTCTVTLRKGTWTVVTTAYKASTATALATRTVRIR